MSNLIIGGCALILLAFMLRYLFSRKLNQTDESIVTESAKAGGWSKIAIISKSTEINHFKFEKITNRFFVEYVDQHGVPRRASCSVHSGKVTWES